MTHQNFVFYLIIYNQHDNKLNRSTQQRKVAYQIKRDVHLLIQQYTMSSGRVKLHWYQKDRCWNSMIK